MVTLRPYAPADLDQLYAISLATGDRGGDASALYRDGRLIGHLYSAPYAALHPEQCLVVEDGAGAAGYVVGAFDTRAFERRLELEWWPALRSRYPDPDGEPSEWSADQRRGAQIHHPRIAPEAVVRCCAAHLHMNILPRLQRRGIGGALMERWMTNAQRHNVSGAHVGVNASNHRAIGFWESHGFAVLGGLPDHGAGGTVWRGRKLA